MGRKLRPAITGCLFSGIATALAAMRMSDGGFRLVLFYLMVALFCSNVIVAFLVWKREKDKSR